jgi:hypothetical protein
MAPDRNKMAQLHEEFLASLTGGRNSRGSGQTWQDPGDGRDNRIVTEYAFAWDGKSTTTKSITVDRAMLAKIREQAGGERPMIGLRWYGTEDLARIPEEWVMVTAADFGELLAAARSAVHFSGPAQIAVPAAPLVTPQPPPPPPYLGGLPPPPHEMWPCLVIDSRHIGGDGPGTRLESKGYRIGDDGGVTEYSIWACRYDMGMGPTRLYVNDLLVPRGQLFIDGELRITVGAPQA